MRDTLEIFKIFSDETRVRILMLLLQKELGVCQIACVLDLSQPLISKNLATLYSSGFLSERKVGKQVFYRIKKNLPQKLKIAVSTLKELVSNESRIIEDGLILKECEEFRNKTGKCDLKAVKEFLEQKRKIAGGINE